MQGIFPGTTLTPPTPPPPGPQCSQFSARETQGPWVIPAPRRTEMHFKRVPGSHTAVQSKALGSSGTQLEFKLIHTVACRRAASSPNLGHGYRIVQTGWLLVPFPAKAVRLQGCDKHMGNEGHSWLHLQWRQRTRKKPGSETGTVPCAVKTAECPLLSCCIEIKQWDKLVRLMTQDIQMTLYHTGILCFSAETMKLDVSKIAAWAKWMD